MSIIWACTIIVFSVFLIVIGAINYFYNNYGAYNKSKPIGYNYLTVFLCFSLVGIYGLTVTSQRNEAELLKSRLAIMSESMKASKHYRLSENTMENDEIYLKIIDTEKTWLIAAEKFFDDIYTMRADDTGGIRLIVDSETDYDHSGKFDSDREQRTKIGEIYDKELPALTEIFKTQKFSYTNEFYTDKWGTWISAFYPLYDRDNNFDGIIGVDISVFKLAAQFLFVDFILALSLVAAYMSYLVFKKNQMISQLLNENLKKHLAESESNLDNQKQFLAIMSHEIRTPLNAIIGSTQLINQTGLTMGDQENLKIAKESSRILSGVIGDVLEYSKIQSGKIQLEKKETHLGQILGQIEGLFKSQMRAKKLDFTMQLDSVLLDKYFAFDEVRFRQILMNFISNALKFTEKGSVKVSIRPEKVDQTTTLIQFKVTDTGIGISVENQKKLFQAFQQGDSSITRKFGGTGLGLIISKHLVELMGGHVYFSSEESVGSTFVFSLHFDNVNSEAAILNEQLLEQKNAQRFQFKKYSELKVLVVDDVKMNQVVLAKTLEKIGFYADIATNGQEAIKKHLSEPYDIIFMDCQMPIMDGLFATKIIRQKERDSKRGKRVSVIAISANVSTEDKNECFKVGMDLFVPKPFSLDQIENALKLSIEASEMKSTHAA